MNNNRKRFVLTHSSSKKYKGWSCIYNYQANIHGVNYKGATFTNDKFQSSIITGCNFKKSKLIGIDFTHCNMKKSKFDGAIFDSVTFFNCNIKDVNFNGAKFKNVFFISMDISKAMNLPETGYTIINSYPTINNPILENSVLKLAERNSFLRYHVLNISANKINKWYLSILINKYGSAYDISRALKALYNRKNRRDFITLFSYTEYLDSYLKV